MRPTVSLLIFWISVLSCGAAGADSSIAQDKAERATGDIIESGLCEVRDEQRYAQPQSTTGYAVLGDVTITERTEVVPLKIGAGFGFHWRATGMPAQARITFRIGHPKLTRPDARQMTGFDEVMTLPSINGVIDSVDCYRLNEYYELVPGDWSQTVMFNGEVLAQRTFHVVRP